MPVFITVAELLQNFLGAYERSSDEDSAHTQAVVSLRALLHERMPHEEVPEPHSNTLDAVAVSLTRLAKHRALRDGSAQTIFKDGVAALVAKHEHSLLPRLTLGEYDRLHSV